MCWFFRSSQTIKYKYQMKIQKCSQNLSSSGKCNLKPTLIFHFIQAKIVKTMKNTTNNSGKDGGKHSACILLVTMLTDKPFTSIHKKFSKILKLEQMY